MYLLTQLLYLCRDARQEVRDGAIQTLFRSLDIYGSTLDEPAWDRCLWEIVFPLFDWLNLVIENIKSREATTTEASGGDNEDAKLVSKQWDASKVLALSSTASVFADFFSPKLVHTARFRETWKGYLEQLRDAFVKDSPLVATAAMECFENLLRSSVKADVPVDEGQVQWAWEEAWTTWDGLGEEVLQRASRADSAKDHFTQESIAAFVRVVNRIQARLTLGLERCGRLLETLRGALTYARSREYRPDIDSLSPVQAAVLDTIDAVNLDADEHLPSLVLSNLAEYTTLAFVAAFNNSGGGGSAAASSKRSVSYIALFTAAIPRVVRLYSRYKDRASIYNDGAVETTLAVCSFTSRPQSTC
jgi:hypothetical protein